LHFSNKALFYPVEHLRGMPLQDKGLSKFGKSIVVFIHLLISIDNNGEN